jgi:parallel beta-helix repeat protein
VRILTLLLFSTLALGQEADWSTTNQFEALPPGVNVPGVTVPEVHSVEIFDATHAPPARPKPTARPPESYLPVPRPEDLARKAVVIRPLTLQQPIGSALTNVPGSSETAASAAGGRQLLVDTFGDDAHTGATQPVRSLQRAAELAQPGDTVLVAPGVYEGFSTVRSGEPSRPITFRAQSPDVIIGPIAGRDDNISVRNTGYIVIDGFTVRDAPRAGIGVIEARGVVVQNCVVGPNGRWGIFTGFAPEVQILNNKTFNCAKEHGIYVSNSRDANDAPIVRGNESFGNAGNGIQFNGDCFAGGDGVISGALIEGNIVHDNGLKGFSLISISDSVIQNNLVYNNGRQAGAGGIHFADEPRCRKPSSGNVAVNNTIVEPRIAGIRFSDGARNNIVFNNIIVSESPVADAAGNQIDGSSNILRDSVSGLFQDPARGDYRLTPSSPARNAGQTTYRAKRAPAADLAGQPRATGLTVDAGAFE